VVRFQADAVTPNGDFDAIPQVLVRKFEPPARRSR
jgi:hypothetical protein